MSCDCTGPCPTCGPFPVDEPLPRCGSCRWYLDRYRTPTDPMGLCQRDFPSGTIDLAAACGTAVEMLTAPDFGCVQWEKRK